MPHRARPLLATVIQTNYAVFGLVTTLISTLDQVSPLRHVVMGSTGIGPSLMWLLAAFSLLSLTDVALNHRRGARWLWLAQHRHWCMLGQIVCWLLVAFIAIPRFDAIGLSLILTVGCMFLGWFLLIEAQTRRAACARDPSSC